MCGAWVFYNMFNITPQGLTTQTTTLTIRGRERDVRRDSTDLSAQSKLICLPLPIYLQRPLQPIKHTTHKHTHTLTTKHYIVQIPHCRITQISRHTHLSPLSYASITKPTGLESEDRYTIFGPSVFIYICKALQVQCSSSPVWITTSPKTYIYITYSNYLNAVNSVDRHQMCKKNNNILWWIE